MLATATVLAGSASAIAGPTTAGSAAGATTPARPQPRRPPSAQAGGSSELSETTRLADRRSLVVGDRAYAMGDESGLYPASRLAHPR